VAEKKFDVLLEAQWLPTPPGTFEDRPPSPGRGAGAPGQGASGGAGAAAAPAKPAGYRCGLQGAAPAPGKAASRGPHPRCGSLDP
jgi:hypothetical protein